MISVCNIVLFRFRTGAALAFIQEPESQGGLQKIQAYGSLAKKKNQQLPVHNGLESDGRANFQRHNSVSGISLDSCRLH
jgi:hypothetical protein